MKDLFDVNPSSKAVDAMTEGTAGNANEFRPNAKKGIAGVYEATIRFIPNPVDPANGSIASKFTIFLKNPLTNVSKEIDCPSTVGEHSPLQEAFFTLRNSENPILKENSKNFSRRQRFASLVQIIDCKSDPSIVGKVLVWRYGLKIYEKINQEMNPSNPLIQAKNPYNLLNGRPFWVKCKMVSGFNNFDESCFFDGQGDSTCVRIPVQTASGVQPMPVNAQTIQNDQIKQQVNTWLTDNCPSLDPYMYHPWDDATRTFVTDCIKIYSNPAASIQAAQQNGAVAGGGFGASTVSAGPAAKPVVDTIGMGGMPVNNAAPAGAPQMPQMGGIVPPTATAPGGFAASNIPDLGGVLGDSSKPADAPVAQASAGVGGGMSLTDVLGDIM